MNKTLCISLSGEQSRAPESSVVCNILRFLRLFAANFFAGPEWEKTGLDRDKTGYSGIVSKIFFPPFFDAVSGHLSLSQLISHKKCFYFLTVRRLCLRFEWPLRRRNLTLPPILVGQSCGFALTSALASEATPAPRRQKHRFACFCEIRAARQRRPTLGAVSSCARFGRVGFLNLP